MEEENNNLSKHFWKHVVKICSLMIVFVIVGFIIFYNRKPEIIEENKEGGFVTLNYTSEINALMVINAKPTTDSVGMKNINTGQYFDFSVDVNLDDASKVEYEISVIKDEKESTISDEDIRIYLEKEESGTYTQLFGPEAYFPAKNYTSVGSEIGSMVLANVKKIKSETDNYRLRMWLSDKATSSGGKYSVEVDIHAVAR